MGLAPTVIKAFTGQSQFAKQRTINDGIVPTFAPTLFIATGATGLLLQKFGYLLFDNGMLHRFKQILGFSQSQPQPGGF